MLRYMANLCKDKKYKKNVIVCGCDLEDQRRIEYFLGVEFRIIGITQPDRESNIFEDDIPFFSIEALKSVSFDYIVIATLASSVAECWKKKLLEAGVAEEKIIEPFILQPYSGAKFRENMVKSIREADDKLVDGLMFGLSYSRKGIDLRKLRGKWFDFSSDGMDLYYNFQLYKYAVKHNKFPNAKKALFVFPNYYFQYDQSRSYAQYTSDQMFAVHELNDWHNFQKTGGDLAKVRTYIINYQMFGYKISEYYHPRRLLNPRTVWDGIDGQGKLPAGWLKEHENTVSEYRDIFRQFVTILSERNVQIMILQPPIYLNGIDEDQKISLKQKNEKFRNTVLEITENQGLTVKIFDFTSLFAERRDLFRDLEHLNADGSVEWGKAIDKIILDNM